MSLDISLIPQERIKDLVSTLDNIQSNINNIGTDLTNNLVHKTGDETITGFKTIENNIFLKDTQGTIGTSTNQWARRIQFTDSAGTRIARLEPKYVDTTTLEMGMYASNGTTTENGIWVRNTGETYAPHPTTAQDSSNKIATTAWVNNLDNSVVHKSGNETITGIKTHNIDNYDIYKSTVMDITNNPSEAHTIGINYADKNGNVHGQSFLRTESNGNVVQSIACLNHSQTSWAQFSVGFDSSDNRFAYLNGNIVKGFVTETYNSGTSWYRKYSDGFIEQGGVMTGNASSKTITLNKPFTTTNYTILTTEREIGSSDTDGVDFTCMVRSVTTTSFSCSTVSGASRNSFWYACGY